MPQRSEERHDPLSELTEDGITQCELSTYP